VVIENGRFLKLAADTEISDGGFIQLGEIDIAFKEDLTLIGPSYR